MNLAPLLTAAASPLPGGGITLGADILSCNLALLPPRAFTAMAGYVTQAGGGTGYIAWTSAQWAQYPDAIRIAQLPAGDPLWADILDFEAGAATTAELVTWARGAQESYCNGTHPGQRMPAVYVSATSVHIVANALAGAGIRSGVGLMLANWNLTGPQAARDVTARSGPFPVIGVQYQDAGPWDLDVWATAWLNTRSGDPGAAPAPARPAPAQNWTEKIMQQLPVTQAGASGPAVRTVQGLCASRGHAVTVDGIFGPATEAAVRAVQASARITEDGIVGPVTWAVLAGVS